MKYLVCLTSCGNPDRGQDVTRHFGDALTQHVPVKSYKEASRECRQYIEEHNLGAGNWTGGEIYDAKTGEVVAHVSYNGRVWRGARLSIDSPEILI